MQIVLQVTSGKYAICQAGSAAASGRVARQAAQSKALLLLYVSLLIARVCLYMSPTSTSGLLPAAIACHSNLAAAPALVQVHKGGHHVCTHQKHG